MLIVGERYREKLEYGLSRAGQTVLWLPDNPDVDPRLAGHADLSVCLPDDRTVVIAEGIYPSFVNYLTIRGISDLTVIPAEGQGHAYPQDAGLCVCATGKYTLYNPKTAHKTVCERLSGIRIAVTQGYTKCSVCVVSDDSIITADDVIASRASSAGMDVLRTAPGHIRLDGFDYGFIGGAAFLVDRNSLAFTGSLDYHPHKAAILAFLEKHAVEPLYLTEEPLFDIGGGIRVPALP